MPPRPSSRWILYLPRESGLALIATGHRTMGARAADGAASAERPDGPADVLAVGDERLVHDRPEPLRHEPDELRLGLFGRLRLHPAEAVRQPVHVRVHRD